MADVRPFYGLRYNLERIGDPSAVICPPFDVISAEERYFYYLKSPYNVIRLESGEDRVGDAPGNNKYLRAAHNLESWLQEETLVWEKEPAFYLIEHRFPYRDSVRSRWGVTARVRIEDWETGQILPHELTAKEPITDRLRLLQSCKANFSPIMGIFRQQKGGLLSLLPKITNNRPDLTAVDSYGVTYNLWVVTDRDVIKDVRHLFAKKVIYIADGHHRYQTALNYQKEQQEANPAFTGDEAFNFVMMTLTGSSDPGLTMLPTHRLVRGLKSNELLRLREEMATNFEIIEVLPPLTTLSETVESWLQALENKGQRGVAFGLYGLHGQHLCLMATRQKTRLQRMMPADQPRLWKSLDVSLLDSVILQGWLGIDSAKKKDCLEFTPDGVEAVSRVTAGESQLAFFLNSTAVSRVLAVADARARMPQKSTYFYPKTPTGLVINPLLSPG